MKNLSGMPVQLALKIASENQQMSDITEKQMLALHAAIEKRLFKIVRHASVEIFATFKQETDSNTYFISAIRLISNLGHDTKLTVKPFLKYQHTNEKLHIQIKNKPYSIELTDRVRFWVDHEAKTYICKDHDALDNISTLVYLDETLRRSSRHRYYQVLSPLLYCLQVKLEGYEFEESDGVVTINSTSPSIAVYNYYKVAPGQIRICVDDYFPKLNIAIGCARKFTESMVYVSVSVWCFKIFL